MPNEIDQILTAKAEPTKRFFVSMLTRDISLQDAILDLVDNCLDGALRLANGNEVDYRRHTIEIEFSEDNFSISDNCGGIELKVLQDYAFKMGREPDDERDSENETIGMYGIGMKRAIFKIGQEATVKTRFANNTYEVKISSDWLAMKEWSPLPISELKEDSSISTLGGTFINVNKIFGGIASHFVNADFDNTLREALSQHFTKFLQKGLNILVNGSKITAKFIGVNFSASDKLPNVYFFRGSIEDVLVVITVGMNKRINSSDFLEDEDSSTLVQDKSVDDAGWTVFCNDRAIIFGDKSRLTGWGLTIPRYHGQFSVITGIVEFRSKNASKLPITTTKRALDTSSSVWLQTFGLMTKGMRTWIDYTNAWKNTKRGDKEFWLKSTPYTIDEVDKWASERDDFKKNPEKIEFDPNTKGNLPKPKTEDSTSRRIVFFRTLGEIKKVSNEHFENESAKPSKVGEGCFEYVMNKISK